MAEFLRQEIYRHDGIEFFSRKQETLPSRPVADDFVVAVLRPEYPLVVVVHDEDQSQTRNEFEQALITPIIAALADPAIYGLDADEGLGVVVPHRAQRAALQMAFPSLNILDEEGESVRTIRYRHSGTLPGGRADGYTGRRYGEQPGVPFGFQRVPARPSPADRGTEPGETKTDPGGLKVDLYAVQLGGGGVRELAVVERACASNER